MDDIIRFEWNDPGNQFIQAKAFQIPCETVSKIVTEITHLSGIKKKSFAFYAICSFLLFVVGISLGAYFYSVNQPTAAIVFIILSPFLAYVIIITSTLGKDRIVSATTYFASREQYFQILLGSEGLYLSSCFYKGTSKLTKVKEIPWKGFSNLKNLTQIEEDRALRTIGGNTPQNFQKVSGCNGRIKK